MAAARSANGCARRRADRNVRKASESARIAGKGRCGREKLWGSRFARCHVTDGPQAKIDQRRGRLEHPLLIPVNNLGADLELAERHVARHDLVVRSSVHDQRDRLSRADHVKRLAHSLDKAW